MPLCKKKLLITGIESYVGTSFITYLSKWPDKYEAQTLDMRFSDWKKHDFSQYDSILHVAGIAHQDPKLISKDMYMNINCHLAYNTAIVAKTNRAKQFIFMSSMSVYGNPLQTYRAIRKDTLPSPDDLYGYSKLKAEQCISALNNVNFRVAILRPPIIYGQGCKGNFSKIDKIAQKIPIFPFIENDRSMIHIENFCEFVKLVIDNEECGLFFPQNNEYVNVSELVKLLGIKYGNKIYMIKSFNFIIKYLTRKNRFFNKLFGSLVYEKAMSEYKFEYQVCNFYDSIYK